MSSMVVFMGATTECLTFDVLDDTALEGTESFTVSITDFGEGIAGSPTSATVVIEDGDGKSS